MKNLGLILALLLFMASCQSNSTQYHINGSIAGLDSGKVYLVKVEQGKAVSVDTTDLTNGKFSFTGTAGVPELHYLRLNERNYFAQFFLDNTTIDVEADKDSLRNTKVTGSPTTDIFNDYLDELRNQSNKMREYQREYQAAAAAGNQDKMDKIGIDVTAAQDNLIVFAKNFVKEHNTSIIGPFITLTQLAKPLPYADLKALCDTFPADFDSSPYMQRLKEIVEEKSHKAVGAQARDFTMNDPEGNPVSVSSFKGKYLLIDFWASWCGPCRQENPNIVRIYNEFKDKGFTILGVSLDRNKDAWLKAIKDDQLDWTQVSDLKYWQNEMAQYYGINSIPHSILLDPDGKIVNNDIHSKELEEKLNKLLK